MAINLKLLHMFVTVAETGSFRRAAEITNRSQSAVSMQIKQAEEQLGIQLFHRTTRKVELTPEGETLLSYARRALAEVESGLQFIKEAVNTQATRLVIGCVPSVSSSVLPPLLAAYRRENPAVSIVVREIASDELLHSIAQQDVEFGIGPRVDKADDFRFQQIVMDPIVAVVPDGFAVSLPGPASLADLARVPIMMYSNSAALRRRLDEIVSTLGIELDIRVEVVHVNTLLAFARAGVGVALVPRIALPPRLGSRLRVIAITNPVLERSLDIITLRGRQISPAAQHLVDLAMKRLGS